MEQFIDKYLIKSTYAFSEQCISFKHNSKQQLLLERLHFIAIQLIYTYCKQDQQQMRHQLLKAESRFPFQQVET